MRYEPGDIIKIDMSEQSTLQSIAIVCPYVRVTELYDSESMMSSAVWGDATLWGHQEQRLMPNTNYFFNARGSRFIGIADG